MAYRSVFKCIAGCDGEYDLEQPLYRCPKCGDLLEVAHDLTALAGLSAAEWKHLFDSRYKRTEWPYGSAVWGKKEWVCPGVRNENIVSMDEGGTNLMWAERFGRELGMDELWIKMCGQSHTGSFKDLGMTVLVSIVRQMVADHKPVRAVACASTGDTSASLAAYAAAAEIPSIVILPRGKVSTAQLVQPLANGALVLSLDTDFDGCMAIVQRLSVEEGVYLANSMNSLRLEGQKTVGVEIVQQFDWSVPDVIIIPGGNLGNVSALGAGFDMMESLGLITKRPRIVVAQAAAANPLYLAYKNNWEFHARDGETDAGVRNPDRQSRVGEKGDSRPAEVQRHRRAGDGSRAGRRIRPRRSHGHVQLPAYGRRARGAHQAARAGPHQAARSHRRHLDGQRTEVHRLQGGVSLGYAGGHVFAARQQAGRAAERLRRSAPRHRHSREGPPDRHPIALQLQDTVFFVTGGASGLGEATARMLVESGARVVIADVNETAGARLASELGGSARFARVDVTDESSVREGLQLSSELGTLRGVVNAAGIVLAEKVLGKNGPHALDAFSRVIQINLGGTFNVIRLASAIMSAAAPTPSGERGVIVNTASVSAFDGQIGQAAYSASKGGHRRDDAAGCA